MYIYVYKYINIQSIVFNYSAYSMHMVKTHIFTCRASIASRFCFFLPTFDIPKIHVYCTLIIYYDQSSGSMPTCHFQCDCYVCRSTNTNFQHMFITCPFEIILGLVLQVDKILSQNGPLPNINLAGYHF